MVKENKTEVIKIIPITTQVYRYNDSFGDEMGQLSEKKVTEAPKETEIKELKEIKSDGENEEEEKIHETPKKEEEEKIQETPKKEEEDK